MKLRRCDIQARNVEVQEGRLERDCEKTAEEEFQKFTEWAENPAVRKAFILAPEARMAAQRRNFGMHPHPQDAAVLREVEADSNAGETPENQENQTEHKPPQTEKPGTASCPGGTTENSPAFQRRDDDTKKKSPEGTAEHPSATPITPLSPSSTSPTSEDVATNPTIKNAAPTASPIRPISPMRPIASSPSVQATQSANSKLNTQNSKLGGHSSPWDSISEPCPGYAPYTTPPQAYPPYENPLKYYGPCEPPYRPGDNWKVQCS